MRSSKDLCDHRNLMKMYVIRHKFMLHHKHTNEPYYFMLTSHKHFLFIYSIEQLFKFNKAIEYFRKSIGRICKIFLLSAILLSAMFTLAENLLDTVL